MWGGGFVMHLYILHSIQWIICKAIVLIWRHKLKPIFNYRNATSLGIAYEYFHSNSLFFLTSILWYIVFTDLRAVMCRQRYIILSLMELVGVAVMFLLLHCSVLEYISSFNFLSMSVFIIVNETSIVICYLLNV